MGAEAIFKMAFEDGFSHGDTHPANLVLTPQGELALFGFGTVGFLIHDDIEALSRLFIAVLQHDVEAGLRALDDNSLLTALTAGTRNHRNWARRRNVRGWLPLARSPG